MAQQKRYPVLLNTDWPPERNVFDAINAVPEGGRSGVLRMLILLGHNEIEKTKEPTVEGRINDGAGTT
jgi:hypothetical protein